MKVNDKFSTINDSISSEYELEESENFKIKLKGEVFINLSDLDGNNLIDPIHINNIVVFDASILIARLLVDNQEPSYGINMLAVGTGALGNLLAPDAPDKKFRKLNAELTRKPFSSKTFRTTGGVAVSYPTNIVDFTTTFGQGEAVGPLNEMGLLSTRSANPSTKYPNPQTFPNYDSTVDLTLYDTLCNYLTFGVITKPVKSNLTITWRLTI